MGNEMAWEMHENVATEYGRGWNDCVVSVSEQYPNFTWNTNFDNAPRGEMVQRKSPKGDGFYDEFVPHRVILATKCGKVTSSYWIPNEVRWCMLSKNEQPVAWMPWPEHPSKAKS